MGVPIRFSRTVRAADVPYHTVAPPPLTDVTIDGETLSAVLKPASWNVIVTRAKPSPQS
jgi:hypothetical protein